MFSAQSSLISNSSSSVLKSSSIVVDHPTSSARLAPQKNNTYPQTMQHMLQTDLGAYMDCVALDESYEKLLDVDASFLYE